MNKLFRLQSLILVLIFTAFAPSVQAADEYYVVIGTFEDESNAREFTNEIRTFFSHASYSFSDTRKLYYVHVLKTTRKEEARNWTLYLKNEKGFKDAWIFTETHEERKEREVYVYSARRAPEASTSEMAWKNQFGVDYIPDIRGRDAVKVKQRLASGHVFKFIVEDNAGKQIPAEVMLVDFEKIKIIESFDNGEHAAIRGTRRNQMVTFVCEVLGFKPETRMYNIDHLSRGRDVQKNKDGVWEVKLKLKKMGVNEFSFMGNTSFYKDAAVLQPSSKEQVQDLLSIMKSNPGYEIIVHSHCNPGGSREIMVPQGKDFFDLSKCSSKRGSARKLTKARAATLRDYLVANGIAKKRIRIIGWGGLEPVAKSTGPDADLNERIEIELTDNGE